MHRAAVLAVPAWLCHLSQAHVRKTRCGQELHLLVLACEMCLSAPELSAGPTAALRLRASHVPVASGAHRAHTMTGATHTCHNTEALQSCVSMQRWCVQGYKVPEGLRATNSMAEAVERSEIILMVVPTQFVARTMTDMAKLLQPHQVGGMLWRHVSDAGPTGRAPCAACHHFSPDMRLKAMLGHQVHGL